MIDVVIPLGRGSKCQDEELRYCLRGIEEYLTGYRYIYIIGELPAWVDGVIHIPMRDTDQRETNIMKKVLKACDTPAITSRFIKFNDDHFLLAPVNAPTYPHYYSGLLSERAGKLPSMRAYRQSMTNTSSVLRKAGHPEKDFDIHTPIVYEKNAFRQTMKKYNFNVPFSLVVKSVYCNTLGIEGEQLQDCKFKKQMTYEQMRKAIADRHVFSIGDEAINKDLWRLLKELYPNKSKYEK